MQYFRFEKWRRFGIAKESQSISNYKVSYKEKHENWSKERFTDAADFILYKQFYLLL